MADKKIDKIQVVQHGESLIVPESLPLRRAAEVLLRKAEYDEQVIEPRIVIPGFIPEVAWAVHETMQRKFGVALAQDTITPFGKRPPMSINVRTSATTSVQVPWGEFSVPGIDGVLSFSSTYDQTTQRIEFVLSGKLPRKYERLLNEIADEAKALLRSGGLMKGKAWGVRLRAADGEAIVVPEPRFFDPDPSVRKSLVFSEDTDERIDVNIFAFIEQSPEMRTAKIPLKRGILLHGDYGTGKTMVSTATAEVVVRNGWTFISCDDPSELAQILRLARDYQPAVVFCEDVDRVTSGERTVSLDDLLNTIDGVESKGTEIMVVLTTNHVDHINKAMLRPGRLDAMIHVAPPDADAAIRLLRQYGAGRIDPDADLSGVGTLLEGNKAATIREVSERSKARAIRRHEVGFVSPASLLRSAKEVLDEERLRMVTEPDLRSEREKAAAVLADAFVKTYGTPVGAPVAVSANEAIAD